MRLAKQRYCEYCGEDLPIMSRSNRIYCDARCKNRAYRHRLREEEQPPAKSVADVMYNGNAPKLAQSR